MDTIITKAIGKGLLSFCRSLDLYFVPLSSVMRNMNNIFSA